jgi:enediyne polyketide synthase
VVRVAALVREGGTDPDRPAGTGIDLVARSEETGFAVDHLAARYRAAPPEASEGPPEASEGPPEAAEGPPGPAEPADALARGPLLDAAGLYGPLFFHGPRFQRITGYAALSGYRCVARIAASGPGRWFGSFQPQRLELGDPGARDAFLHALQGCVPDRRVLPVGVGRLLLHRQPEGDLTLDAHQRGEDGDGYVFDVAVRDRDGGLVERWYGLELRAVGPLARDRWPVELIGAYLARSLRRWRPGIGVDLAVAAGVRGDPARTRAVAGWLAGAPVTHGVDGRLVVVCGGAFVGATSSAVSASHLDDWLLVAAGPPGTAVDWQRVDGVPPLDPAAAAVAAELGGDPAVAATRLWTCREVLAKRGLAPDSPLVLGAPGPGGWVPLRSGGYALYSIALPTAAGPVAVCVGVGEPDA